MQLCNAIIILPIKENVIYIYPKGLAQELNILTVVGLQYQPSEYKSVYPLDQIANKKSNGRVFKYFWPYSISSQVQSQSVLHAEAQ